MSAIGNAKAAAARAKTAAEKKKEEEEKRKREQAQGARRRQTNQGSAGNKSSVAAITQTVKQKQAQVNAQQARNRKSTDTRANSGKSAPQTAKAKDSGTKGSAANRKSTDTRANSGKNGVESVRSSVLAKANQISSTEKGKQRAAAEQAMQTTLDRARFIDDVARRMGTQYNNIAGGTYFSPYSAGALERAGLKKYYEPGLTENNPNTPAGMVKSALPAPQLDQVFLHQEIKDKQYGLGKDKLDPAALLAATALPPLDAMRVDPRYHGPYGWGLHVRSKPWDKGLTDKEKVQTATERVKEWNRKAARNRSAAEQNLSRHDRKLKEQFQQEIRLAKADYDAAKARGDTAGMQAAHKRAETWRRIEGGYSGGATGMEHITPKLEQSDISALNKTGQTRLRAAKLGYENAQTDQERARYAAMGQDIRRNPAYLKETYDRGAYRETDANGRMRYAGTAEERAKETEQALAVPKAIGTGIAGALLSIPGTTARALQADASRNQAALQRLSDIRGGGEVNISEPDRLRTGQEILAELRNNERYQNANAISRTHKLARAMQEIKDEVPLGQRLLNRSDIYRGQATEGQTGLNRYLTEALITGGEMIPGLAATALTGGMAAPGLAVMGAQAAGRRMGDLERQGEDPVRAFNRGLATGLIEAATERIPLGNLTKIAKGGGKSFARNMLTQALEEVATEELSEVGNYAADRAFGDPNASLTAQDLKDTAVISLLTSLGMGAGAGIAGSRRTGLTGRQTAARAADQTGTRSGAAPQRTAAPAGPGSGNLSEASSPVRADLESREQEVRAEIETWKMQTARNRDRLANTGNDPVFRDHLLRELAKQEEEGRALREQLLGIQRMRQEQVRGQTRRAEEERIAEESRYQPGRARDAGAELAAGQLSRVDNQAQAARDRLAEEELPAVTAMRDAIRGAVERTGQNTERQTAGGPLAPLDIPQRSRQETQEPEGRRATSARYGQAENHIDNRVSQDMGDRRVKAFQWDHPEVKPYFKRAAAALKQQAEYADSTKTAQRASSIQQARGKKAGTVMAKSEPIRQLMDRGLSTTDIIRACDAIIHDQGQENYAAAKRVELALDDMLSNGYRPIEAAGWEAEDFVSPNTDYLQVKETLPGAVARGSFEEYLRHNAIALETGEVTEAELRQEWEEDRRIREDRESLYRAAEGWGQNPRRYRTMEDELAAHAERVSEWMDEPEMQNAPEEYWRRYWQQAREEEQRIREKWAGREAQTPRVREYVDPETGEIVREERRPAAAEISAPAVTSAPVLTETVREEGQKNTPREAEESTKNQRLNVSDQDPYSVGAAPGGFDPYSHMQNEYGTIEPGENPARMVDVPLSTNGEDRVSKAARTFMEAGLTSEATQRNIERDIVRGMFSYNVKGIEETVDRAYDYLDRNGLEAAEARWDNVVQGRIKTTEDELALGMALWANAERTGKADRASALAAQIAAEGTTAGRMVNIYRMLKRATPEGRVYYARKMYDKIQEDLNKKYGKKAPKLEVNEELLEDYRTAETEKERFDTLDRIYEDVARQMPRRIGDIVNAWRYFAMLGNPRTHIRNVVGNVLFGELERASGKVSAAMQRTLPQEQRTRSLTTSREAREFASRDAEEMEQMLRGGKYDSDLQGIQRKVQERALGPFSFLSKGNSRLLGWEDFRAKRRVYRRSMAGYITAKGWDPANLTTAQLEQARGHAYHDAQVATFQEENRVASAISRLEQVNSATKVTVGGLMPFKGVPLNIAKQGLVYSPFGALKSGIELHRALEDMKSEVRTGNKTAAQAMDGMAKGLTGSSILALGALLAAKGLLTTGGTDDDDLDELETAQGGQEYALKIGDYSYTLDWAAPSVLPLFMGAEAYNIGKELFDAKDGEEGEEAGDANAAERSLSLLNAIITSGTRFYDPMFNMTVLSGLSGAINSAAYGESQAAGVLINALQNYGGQFVPTVLGQVNRTFFDDTRRTTFVDKNKGLDASWQRFVQRQTNKIPGLSQKNMPYLDVWGRESRQENIFLRAFENFLSPGYLKKAEDSEVSEELNRLYEAGFEDVLPTKPKASATIAKEHLNKDQYEARAKAQGKTALDLLTEAMKGEAYQGMTDEEKAAYVASIFDYAKEKGKEAAGGEATKKVAALDQAAKDHDIGVSALLQASLMIDSTADANGNEKVDTEEAWNVIKDMDGPEELKRAAFDMYNGTSKDYDTYAEEYKVQQVKAEMKAKAEEKMNQILSQLPEDARNALTAAALDGDVSKFTQAEAYSAIKSLGLSAKEEKLGYEGIAAVTGWTTEWEAVSKTQAQAEKTREQHKKYLPDVSDERLEEVNVIIQAYGGYNVSLTRFAETMTAAGVPKSEWPGWYAIYQVNRDNPWNSSYAENAKKKGW